MSKAIRLAELSMHAGEGTHAAPSDADSSSSSEDEDGKLLTPAIDAKLYENADTYSLRPG